MLDRVPEVSLLVADSLPLVDLSHLSLVNRSLHALCRARLFAAVKLVSGTPWTDDEKEQEKQDNEIERKVDSLLSANDSTLKLVKHLSIVGCDWTGSEAGSKKLNELAKKLKLEGVEFLHHSGNSDGEDSHYWLPFSLVLASQSPSTLAILGRPRPQQAWGRLVLPRDFPASTTSLASLSSALPSTLTDLSLSGIEVDEEDSGLFPSSLFRTLKSLTLVELYRAMLSKLQESFQTYAADPSNPISLENLSLDLCPEREASGGEWTITLSTLLEFLTTFKRAPLTRFSIGSTGNISSGGLNMMAFMSFGLPLGIQAAPSYEAEHVKELVSTISSNFPSLQNLTLRLDPRSEGWYEKLKEEDMVEIVQSLAKLSELRRFTTNALLPRDDLSDASSTDTKQEEEDDLPPPASLHEATARFFLTHLPNLETVSLVEVLEVPHEAFLEPKKEEEEEKKKKVRRTWRAFRNEKEGAKVEMVEVS